MWSNFFVAGGFGMIPTSVFGFGLVAASVIYLLRPERRFVPLLASLGILTLGSGFLGFSVGVVNTLHYLERVAPAEQLRMAALGFAESAHNVVLSLILIVLAALLASIGAFRAARTLATAG